MDITVPGKPHTRDITVANICAYLIATGWAERHERIVPHEPGPHPFCRGERYVYFADGYPARFLVRAVEDIAAVEGRAASDVLDEIAGKRLPAPLPTCEPRAMNGTHTDLLARASSLVEEWQRLIADADVAADLAVLAERERCTSILETSDENLMTFEQVIGAIREGTHETARDALIREALAEERILWLALREAESDANVYGTEATIAKVTECRTALRARGITIDP